MNFQKSERNITRLMEDNSRKTYPNDPDEFRKDTRKTIEVETMPDGRFSPYTRYAMENTLNPSLICPPEGPRLSTEAEALYVLSKLSAPLEMSEDDFIYNNIAPMHYRSSSMKFPQVPIAPKFVKLIKEMNVGSGVPHATLTSTVNNILDRFFASNIQVSHRVRLGFGKAGE